MEKFFFHGKHVLKCSGIKIENNFGFWIADFGLRIDWANFPPLKVDRGMLLNYGLIIIPDWGLRHQAIGMPISK